MENVLEYIINITMEINFSSKVYSKSLLTRRAERASNLTFSKCLHLVDLNNPRILMMHDKMAVTANIRAQTVQGF